MILCIISFTEKGIRLSERIGKELEKDGVDCALFTRWSGADKEAESRDGGKEKRSARYVKESLSEWTQAQMQKRRALLFIGACGIAVRAVAPYLQDKLKDSPVLVMDETGRFVIPLLSGHVGGANDLALLLAERTGAEPVITTATDRNGVFAVDLFAEKNRLWIENREGIARVSARALSGRKITLSIQGNRLEADAQVPDGVRLIPWERRGRVDAAVCEAGERAEALLLLRPRPVVLGMGCKKGTEAEKIDGLIRQELKQAGIPLHQVCALATIDAKREEPGLVQWCGEERVDLLTFSAGELAAVEGTFHASAFVRERMGVDNVCERAALLACGPGGRLILEKRARDGMTLAAAEKEWRIRF